MTRYILLAALALAAGDASALDAEKLFNKGSVTNDPEETCLLYEEAAALGHLKASYNLADCYRTGRGRPQDIDRAMTLYRSAAASGDIHAKTSLAILYLFDAPPDLRDAGAGIDLLMQVTRDPLPHPSDAQTLSLAHFFLGVSLHQGLGIQRSDEEAMTHLATSASLANPSMTNRFALVMLHDIYSGRTTFEVPSDKSMANDIRRVFEAAAVTWSSATGEAPDSMETVRGHLVRRGLLK